MAEKHLTEAAWQASACPSEMGRAIGRARKAAEQAAKSDDDEGDSRAADAATRRT